ncbi:MULTISPECIES: hypothetical protein [unclassified Micromonospora]|uniref:hypothetical protein n=1 Tax=unclassified Micromonospora TaxID=2617518 RepID=UPI00241730DA|nr:MULTISPECIES: hypothetical protein [unclassified Micromonospora]MDG4817028.1 hypothetical protein [Micromonospora sp. WMMD956]WFE59606.1 hypothetical protein O7633_23360 [Micromonospora sp. WMMD712]
MWEQLDSLALSDGVFCVSVEIEMQPRLNLWGHPEQPDLRERLANDRPHGIGGKKLLRLLCVRHRIQNNLPRIPVWLTFVEGRHGPMFRHEDGRSPCPEHEPETDTHKRSRNARPAPGSPSAAPSRSRCDGRERAAAPTSWPSAPT